MEVSFKPTIAILPVLHMYHYILGLEMISQIQ